MTMLKVFTVGRVASASQLVTDPNIEKMSMHLEVVPIGWHKGREGNDHQAAVPVQLDDTRPGGISAWALWAAELPSTERWNRPPRIPAALWSKPGRWTICPTANQRTPQQKQRPRRQARSDLYAKYGDYI